MPQIKAHLEHCGEVLGVFYLSVNPHPQRRKMVLQKEFCVNE
jgi:hypothetical protein